MGSLSEGRAASPGAVRHRVDAKKDTPDEILTKQESDASSKISSPENTKPLTVAEKAQKVFKFWFGPTFQPHRIVGLIYLIQLFAALVLYVFDYKTFLAAPFWMLPVCGFLQAVIACFTFTFLPKKKQAGHVTFGDVGALSYRYIAENTFFSLLLAFAWLYMDDRFHKPFFRKTHVFEILFVFFPNLPFIRNRWPKSSFRDSYNDDVGMRKANRSWFQRSTMITKVFYIFAKHYMGYFINYMRYLDRIGPDEQMVSFGLMLGGCWGTTVAMFIHTLKFKGYISAKTGAIAYQASFPWMTLYFIRLALMLRQHLDIFVITTIGMLLNNSYVTKPWLPTWHIYQVGVFLFMSRGIVHNLW